MPNSLKINEDVTIAGQPTKEELEQLVAMGFKSIINCRKVGEDMQPISPDAEREIAEAAGLSYAHVPVNGSKLDPSMADAFREQYAKLPKPIYAHCKMGPRAGVMVIVQMACDEGLTGEQATEKVRQAGFNCSHPAMRQFINDYVASR